MKRCEEVAVVEEIYVQLAKALDALPCDRVSASEVTRIA